MAIGTAAFYAFGAVLPGLSLGPTVGHLAIELTAVLGSTVTAVEGVHQDYLFAFPYRTVSPNYLIVLYFFTTCAAHGCM